MLITITGDDSARISQRLQSLAKGVDDGFAAFNRIECNDLDDAIATARSFPFGSGDRVTIFRAPAKWKEPDSIDIPKLPNNSILVLVFQKLDGRKKFAKALKKLGKLESYAVLSPWDTRGQISLVEDQAQLLDVQLERGVAESIALTLGADTHRINQALQQLSAYCNGKITHDAVDEVLIRSTQTGLDLADAILAEKRQEAFQLLKELLALGFHPLQLLASLVSRCNKVFIAKVIPGDDAAELAGLGNPKQLYYLRKTDVTIQRLQRILDSLLNAEVRIKSGADGVIELEKIVVV